MKKYKQGVLRNILVYLKVPLSLEVHTIFLLLFFFFFSEFSLIDFQDRGLAVVFILRFSLPYPRPKTRKQKLKHSKRIFARNFFSVFAREALVL